MSEHNLQIAQWMSFASVHLKGDSNEDAKLKILKSLDGILLSRSFLVSNHVTVADALVLWAVHPLVVRRHFPRASPP